MSIALSISNGSAGSTRLPKRNPASALVQRYRRLPWYGRTLIWVHLFLLLFVLALAATVEYARRDLWKRVAFVNAQENSAFHNTASFAGVGFHTPGIQGHTLTIWFNCTSVNSNAWKDIRVGWVLTNSGTRVVVATGRSSVTGSNARINSTKQTISAGG